MYAESELALESILKTTQVYAENKFYKKQFVLIIINKRKVIKMSGGFFLIISCSNTSLLCSFIARSVLDVRISQA